MSDVYGFQNMLAPGVDICITFQRKPPTEGSASVEMQMQAQVLPAYTKTLLLAVSELSDADNSGAIRRSIEEHSVKTYRYEEPIQQAGSDADWANFCARHQESG